LQSRVYVDINMLILVTAFCLHNNINLQTFHERWQAGQDARKFQVAKLRRSMIASSRLQSSALMFPGIRKRSLRPKALNHLRYFNRLQTLD